MTSSGSEWFHVCCTVGTALKTKGEMALNHNITSGFWGCSFLRIMGFTFVLYKEVGLSVYDIKHRKGVGKMYGVFFSCSHLVICECVGVRVNGRKRAGERHRDYTGTFAVSVWVWVSVCVFVNRRASGREI